MASLTWRDVWRHRLARHALLEPARADTLTDVVRDVCGIHAQVMACGELSLGLRVEGLTQRDVRSALWEQGSLVKTYGLRGTVHLFAADDLPTMLAALRARTPPRAPNSPERVPEVIEAMREALDERSLTKAELGRELAHRLGNWITDDVFPAFGGFMPRWQLALITAAHQGVLAFGPNRGNQVTFRRLAALPRVDGEQALREVFLRYLQAYGPATHAQFARWFYMDPSAARALQDSVADRLEEVDVEGWRAWRTRDPCMPPAPAGSVHLLPQYDCYVVGCHPREQLIPPHAPDQLRKMGTAAPYAVLLVDGVVSGLWTRQRRGKRIEIRVDPFAPLTREQRGQVAAQAARIGEILDGEVALTFDSVEPRPHL